MWLNSLIAISENLERDFELVVSIKASILDHDINGSLCMVTELKKYSYNEFLVSRGKDRNLRLNVKGFKLVIFLLYWLMYNFRLEK